MSIEYSLGFKTLTFNRQIVGLKKSMKNWQDTVVDSMPGWNVFIVAGGPSPQEDGKITTAV